MTRPHAILLGLGALAVAAAAALLYPGVSPAPEKTASQTETLRCLVAASEESASPHPGMVWIPGGTLKPGDTVYPEEGPFETVEVMGFWMDRHEVTNAEFAQFVEATGYVTRAERKADPAAHPGMPQDMLAPGAAVFVMPEMVENGNIAQWWRYIEGANWRHPGGPGTSIENRGHFPVVALAYDDVAAYARWKGRALPSEAQWEWAARGGRASTPDHQQPKEANTWQGVFPVMNTQEDGFAGVAPVGCFQPNDFGLYDMVGNVWEWTSDLFRADRFGQAGGGPDNPSASLGRASASLPRHVIKGGSFLCAPNYCMRYRPGSRQPQDADLGSSHLGFRTILIAPPPNS